MNPVSPSLLLTILGLLLCTFCTVKSDTIAEIAAENGNFNTLVFALDKVDLVDVLKGEGPFTVFAPTDAAFEQLRSDLGPQLYDSVIADDDLLTCVLTYHVKSGAYKSKRLKKRISKHRRSLKMLNGQRAPVEKRERSCLFINESRIVTADIKADNGIIHIIDRVLVPDFEKC
jgi:uncharacterized surface protein with fasciclin (FAS1) repeats